MAVYSSVTGAMSSILSPVTSQAWAPLVTLCKNGTLSQFQNLKHGKLVIFEGGSNKSSVAFGSDKEGLPIAFLDVRDEKFWVRIALFADMVCNRFTLEESNRQMLMKNRALQRATCWEKSQHQI
jgi:cyclopropane-fatty-acyl-phospholipid synthase